MAIQPRTFIDAFIIEPCIEDLDDLMPWFACVGEDTFQRADQSNITDRKRQLFLHFSGNGFDPSFTELNAAANRAKERLLCNGVVELVDQYLSLMMEDTQSEGANAWF